MVKLCPLIFLDKKMGIHTNVEVYTFLQMTEWSQDYIINFIDEKTYHQEFFSRPLKTPVGVLTVFIHNPTKDGVSGRVHKSRQYEPEIMELILQFVGSEKNISFIDIGANIGLHTVVVAKYGKPVLAVEMMHDNVQHLCMSAEHNGLQRQIKVVSNALGKNHAPSKIISGKNGRFGGGYANDSSISSIKNKYDGDIYNDVAIDIPTVMLDDLLTWKHIHLFQELFIKMDVEGGEASVMEGAKRFLKMTRITGILMEWRWHRERPHTARTIISIMQELKLNPFQPIVSRKKNTNTAITDVEEVQKLYNRKLAFKKFSSWPHDVLWLPSV